MSPFKALIAAAAATAATAAATAGFALALQRSAAAASHELPPYVLPPAIRPIRGKPLYFKSCAHCHGADATGDEGPDLHGLEISDRRIATVIKRGIKGEMPSFARKHDDTQIAELVAYVRSLQ